MTVMMLRKVEVHYEFEEDGLIQTSIANMINFMKVVNKVIICIMQMSSSLMMLK